MVERLLGHEGESFGNAELVDLCGLGGWTQPNDHSRRDNDKDWCTKVNFLGRKVMGPNEQPFQNRNAKKSCGCFLGPHHIFLSSARCTIDDEGIHHHSRRNTYQVVETLRWCNGTEAS